MAFLPQHIVDELEGNDGSTSVTEVLRGDDIFTGEAKDYPRTWNGLVGQRQVKEELQVKILAAKKSGRRLEHILLEAGEGGVGKTTVAYMVAHHMGVGILPTAAPLAPEEFFRLARQLDDGDVLFVDEVHRQVDGGQNKADWLLTWMLGGGVKTAFGMKKTPDITLIAATTAAGKLPSTVLSRFMTTPQFEPYTELQAADIVGSNAERIGVPLEEEYWPAVARAADRNPRVSRKILMQIRDLYEVAPDTHPNLDRALAYSGVSEDGLSRTARHMLCVLAVKPKHTASIDTIGKELGEPGSLRHPEQQLLQHGLIQIVGQGRQLTDRGVRRATEEVRRG